MKLTKHANIRAQQRGISPFIIEIILQFGVLINAPGGVTKIRFGKKEYQRAVSELKRLIQSMDKAKDRSAIVNGDTIITLY